MQEEKQGAVISETHSPTQEGVAGKYVAGIEREQTIADDL